MLRKAILKAMWWLLKLRYRVVIQGEELLQDPRFVDKGVLILPNHTAEMEPFVMMALLERRWNTVPLVVENFYQYAKEAMNIVGARPVPEFDTAVNSYKLKTAETLFQEVVADLEAKKAILLYPSSGLKVSGVERVGGRSLAHSLVQAVPETEVLLVRITGFWGLDVF